MENILKKHKITDYGVVDFQLLNIFETRSKARIPHDCRCAVAMIFPYYNKSAFEGNISAYCSVKDYHDVIDMQLKSICEERQEKYPEHSFVPFVDASPVDEVDMCVKAGLGVRGKNTLLVNKKYGSFIFIGEILTTLALPTVNYPESACLNCGLCIKACPGNAISEKGLDKTRCASYISQKKQELTEEEMQILQNAHTVFGCDICQTVCPMNKNIHFEENLFSDDIINTVTSENVADLYKQRPFGFRGLKVLQRNLEIYSDNNSK